MISAERATEIAEIYYDDVYHLCLSRLKKETDAADVAQEVFLFFQENYNELEDELIRSWLFSVANNKIKEQFREIARREKELILASLAEVLEGPDVFFVEDNVITDEELEQKKQAVLSSLSEKELELFEMVYTKHMEYAELAKALNISESALRTRICRLKAKIKEKVSFMFMVLLLLVMKL